MTRPDYGHPLYGAELRLSRSRRLIGQLDRQYEVWAKLQANAGWEKTGYVEETGTLIVSPKSNELRFLHIPRMAITLGEAIYNIRAALDYLVYSIAGAANNGVPVSGTQFPLESDPAMYWARFTGRHKRTGKSVPRFLKNVPRVAAEDLAQYQPFSGCAWTTLLRDISNADKHRHLTVLSTASTYKPSADPLKIVDLPDGQVQVHFKGEMKVEVSLKTGEDVIDAAREGAREARKLIRSYADHFEIPGPRFVWKNSAG